MLQSRYLSKARCGQAVKNKYEISISLAKANNIHAAGPCGRHKCEHVKLPLCLCVANQKSHMARLLSGTEELMGYLSSEDTQPKTRRNKQACLTGSSLAIMINKHII